MAQQDRRYREHGGNNEQQSYQPTEQGNGHDGQDDPNSWKPN
jgi:hypothetical protein